MNLLRTILGERSKAMCNKVVRYVGNDPRRFEELLHVFLAGPYRVTQWASWPMNYCVEKHPELAKPHLRKIINTLRNPLQHNSLRRNVCRMLSFIDVPPSLQGKLSAFCFDFLTSGKEPVAVKVFAMSVLARIAKQQPDLRSELRMVIEDQLPFATPGFRSRAQRILKDL